MKVRKSIYGYADTQSTKSDEEPAVYDDEPKSKIISWDLEHMPKNQKQ